MTTEPHKETPSAEPAAPSTTSSQWVPITVMMSATAALIAGAAILVVNHPGSAGWTDQRIADTINKNLNSDPNAAPGAEPPAQYQASDVPSLLATYCPVLNNSQAMVAKADPDGTVEPGTAQWEKNAWRVASVQAALQISGRCSR